MTTTALHDPQQASTDAGMTADEPVERLGERLSLPPFLEGRRSEIEKELTPL